MGPGQTYQFSWQFLDSNFNSLSTLLPVHLALSSSTIASLNTTATNGSSATVTAIAGGMTVITVSQAAFNLSDTLGVTVTPPQSVPSSISLSPLIIAGFSGTSTVVQAVVRDSNGTALTGQTVTWSTTASAATITLSADDASQDPIHQTIATFVGATASTESITATV